MSMARVRGQGPAEEGEERRLIPIREAATTFKCSADAIYKGIKTGLGAWGDRLHERPERLGKDNKGKICLRLTEAEIAAWTPDASDGSSGDRPLIVSPRALDDSPLVDELRDRIGAMAEAHTAEIARLLESHQAVLDAMKERLAEKDGRLASVEQDRDRWHDAARTADDRARQAEERAEQERQARLEAETKAKQRKRFLGLF